MWSISLFFNFWKVVIYKSHCFTDVGSDIFCNEALQWWNIPLLNNQQRPSTQLPLWFARNISDLWQPTISLHQQVRSQTAEVWKTQKTEESQKRLVSCFLQNETIYFYGRITEHCNCVSSRLDQCLNLLDWFYKIFSLFLLFVMIWWTDCQTHDLCGVGGWQCWWRGRRRVWGSCAASL